MATKQINWNDGSSDKISIIYSGNKNDTVQVSSDSNEYVDRSIQLNIEATNCQTRQVTVNQSGLREVFSDDFRLNDGSTFNVLKENV